MKRLFYVALVAGNGACLMFCAPKSQEKVFPDKVAAMKAAYSTMNECFNTGNTESVDTILSASAVEHPSDSTIHATTGPAGLKQFIVMMRKGSPDLKSKIRMMSVEGDLLWAYGTLSGTNTGDLMRRPASNKPWSSNFVDIVRFNPRLKIIEHWGVYDQYKMMRDLGTIPL